MTEAQALAIARQTGPASAGQGTARLRLVWGTATLTVAGLLILLTWANTLRGIRVERHAASDHALASLAADAHIAAVAFTHREGEAAVLLSLLALQASGDPAGFSLPTAVAAAGLALPPGSELVLRDATGTVRQTMRAARPARVVSAGEILTLRSKLAAPPLAVPTGAAGSPTVPFGPGGTLSLRIPLQSLLAPLVVARLPADATLALIGTKDARVRIALSARRPGPRPGGWLLGPGPSAIGVTRPAPGAPRVLFARYQVPGHALALVILRPRAAALAPVRATTAGTSRLAIAITVLIALAMLVVLGEIEAMIRRERRLARDGTILAEANAALARAKRDADAKTAQLEGLLAGLPVGVLMMDAAQQLVAWNPQVAALSGLPAGLLRVGTTLEEMLRAQAEVGEFGSVAIEAEVAYRLALVAGAEADGCFQRPRPGGGWVEIRRAPLPGGGFVTMFTDITERRRADLALAEARATADAANAAKSRFVAMVSHEIRTPLQALLSGLELLADAPLDPTGRRLLAGMRQSGVALLRLLGDVLDVSRIEAGRLALHAVPIDPRAPLEQAIAMLAPAAAERGIRLSLTAAADVPDLILADPERLGQIVANLLSNAIKFSRPGTVGVTIARGPAALLRIVVTDPGPAIAPDRRAQLFQRFAGAGAGAGIGAGFGAEGAAGAGAAIGAAGAGAGTGAGSGAGSGAGLGLSICHDLVTAMVGEIGYAADPAGGNAFWFTLPLVTAAPDQDPRPGATARRKLRVLLAEDVAISRLVTATMLRREGHAVTEAADGAAAAAAAARALFDVVLMDLDLPIMDGLTAARRIRALPGAAGTVPILALSGHVGAEEQGAARAAGMNEVIAKPAGREALLAALARHAAPAPDPGSDPEPDPTDDILSIARLTELRETLAPEALARVTEECIDELTSRLALLRSALAAGDATAAGAAAHAMAGLAGGYGMVAFERAARAAMAALRAGRIVGPVANPAGHNVGDPGTDPAGDPALADGALEVALAQAAREIRAALDVRAD